MNETKYELVKEITLKEFSEKNPWFVEDNSDWLLKQGIIKEVKTFKPFEVTTKINTQRDLDNFMEDLVEMRSAPAFNLYTKLCNI